MKRLGATVIALIMLLTAAPPPLAAQSPSLSERAEKLIARIAKRPQRAWDFGYSLRAMAVGENSDKLVPLFEKHLDHENEYVQMVCARLVLFLGEPEVAYETLGDLIRSENSEIVEATAILLSNEGADDDLLGYLRDAWEDSADLSVGARVSLCEALYANTNGPLALEQLNEFLTSGDHERVARAALSLGELGKGDAVAGRIELLAHESGDLGRLARLGIAIHKTRKGIEEIKKGAATRAEPLLRREIRVLKEHYVDDYFWYDDQKLALT
ncbi:MAG: hypothetical protein IIB77_02435, partial [Proteobacteria bacterium]|nr:hypothetical protein [Pseudomonadota bacterium]